jgi:hypothetical protein
MNWHKWADLDSFNLWHDAVNTALGFPRFGENSATGEIDTDAQATENYTQPVIQADGVYALVESDIAEVYAANLGEVCEMPESKKSIL